MALIWDGRDPSGNEIELEGPVDDTYQLLIHSDLVSNTLSFELDRKQMKDLFNAIGNELNAFYNS